jgi:UDP-N-acetylglucosamine 2-epimerase (non-hydrolysing)
MPEEINRLLTDAIADYLFITEESARKNLLNEGISHEKIFFVGNTMIDTLLANKPKIEKSTILKTLRLERKKYAVLTLHRPSNVDKKEDFLNILLALQKITARVPIIFPAHPRTVNRLSKLRFNLDFLEIVPPMGYIDFLSLVEQAKFVLTDSGGIQEETSILGVPCLTLRKNTERPITVEQGTNRVVGTDPHDIENAAAETLEQPVKREISIKYWDGMASERIANLLLKKPLGEGGLYAAQVRL